MRAITSLLEGVRVGNIAVAGELAMIPLVAQESGNRSYKTLDEAMSTGSVAVTEISDTGSVPQLLLRNETDTHVLLIDGETVIGAKQNRTLNVSIYAPPKQDIILPVSCVEAGRWVRRSHSFKASRDHMFASGRARMMGDVHKSMDEGFEPRAQQGRVWADIDRKMGRMGVDSPTRAMDDMFTHLDSRIENVASKLQVQPGQVGAIFCLRGLVVGLDCFDHPDTFAILLPKILRSYGLDAIDEQAELRKSTIATAEEFLLLLAQASQVESPSPGIGTHLRLKGEHIIGSALVVDDKVVHVCAFWADSESRSKM